MRIVVNIIIVVINISWAFIMSNRNAVTAAMVMVVIIYMPSRPFIIVMRMLVMRHLLMMFMRVMSFCLMMSSF